MAILEDLGLEIKIVVDNSPLQEYEGKEVDAPGDGFSDDIRKCRRYVKVNVDTEFGVQICTTPNNEYLDDNKKKRLIVSIDLDGQKDLQVTLVGSLKRSDLVEGKSEHNGQTSVLRKFRFKTVSTVDDDDIGRVHKDKKTAEVLGLIRVRIWRGEVTQNVPKRPHQTTSFGEIEDHLAEKALSHRAILSAAVPADAIPCAGFAYLETYEVPLAIFFFNYRPKAILQEELVIPRSREPSPVDVDSLPLREIHRLAGESLDILPLHKIRRLAQLRLLSGKEGNNTSSKGDVKREPGKDLASQQPRKFVKMSNGREAVDLTDED
ncbi:hypothetical protein F5883DRAFT_613592 [Diaporthe sp. PMI_573]|nr:hypothetical protein F5883DRAFT_613592 [Diaporthaceae sp. PMI_573]